ncbi:Hit family protein 1 [Tolypocladium ophioglossoides CBS 100239]|uniref:Hit family protein 1 n=1 Tax=Tolypocladium ophioglossoides (strain CBS 100239) TaxID=1163406 RepID=A0A0L0N9F9_TOLOC|nr:Hit family protein 1 [Tolypocladium ophioglossoides CBS 100239]
MATCLFCRIIKGDIPCMKLFESEKTLAFLDIGPLSKGHAVCCTARSSTAPRLISRRRSRSRLHLQLVIPKHHGAKLIDIPDDQLTEILTPAYAVICIATYTGFLASQPTLKKLVSATGATDYNILQNNGTIAHQQVHHIPKPNKIEGLGISWPATTGDMDKLKALCEDIKSKM